MPAFLPSGLGAASGQSVVMLPCLMSLASGADALTAAVWVIPVEPGTSVRVSGVCLPCIQARPERLVWCDGHQWGIIQLSIQFLQRRVILTSSPDHGHLRVFLSLEVYCRKSSKEAQPTTTITLLLTLPSLFFFFHALGLWLVFRGTSGIRKRRLWAAPEHQFGVWHWCYPGHPCSWRNLWWAGHLSTGHLYVLWRPHALEAAGVGCGGVGDGMARQGSALTRKKGSPRVPKQEEQRGLVTITRVSLVTQWSQPSP